MDALARLIGPSTISPDGLHRRTQEGGPVSVIDVNSPSSRARAHIPGAPNLDSADYTASELPPDRSAALLFYCSDSICREAPRAARRARDVGYGNGHVMSAGISGWLSAKLPTDASA